jgi:hypothetical protein
MLTYNTTAAWADWDPAESSTYGVVAVGAITIKINTTVTVLQDTAESVSLAAHNPVATAANNHQM